MKKYGIVFLLVIIAMIAAAVFFVKNDKAAGKSDGPKVAAEIVDGRILVADFESSEPVNNIGEKYGIWDKDPSDETQSCRMSIAAPGLKETGSCLKLTYDVDSPNPAYNGFYLLLGGVDASKMSNLSFWVKGDLKGYPKEFKVEVKDNKGVSPYIAKLSGNNWQEVVIPFSNLLLISEFNKLKEFVIVFEDSKSAPKTGAIYIDDISFKQ